MPLNRLYRSMMLNSQRFGYRLPKEHQLCSCIVKLLEVPISEEGSRESPSSLNQRQAQHESLTPWASTILTPQIELVTVPNQETSSRRNRIGLCRVNGIHEVEGSIPFSSTKIKPAAFLLSIHWISNFAIYRMAIFIASAPRCPICRDMPFVNILT